MAEKKGINTAADLSAALDRLEADASGLATYLKSAHTVSSAQCLRALRAVNKARDALLAHEHIADTAE